MFGVAAPYIKFLYSQDLCSPLCTSEISWLANNRPWLIHFSNQLMLFSTHETATPIWCFSLNFSSNFLAHHRAGHRVWHSLFLFWYTFCSLILIFYIPESLLLPVKHGHLASWVKQLNTMRGISLVKSTDLHSLNTKGLSYPHNELHWSTKFMKPRGVLGHDN